MRSALGPGAEVHRRIPGREFFPEAGELRPGRGGTAGAADSGLGAAERHDPCPAAGAGKAPQQDPADG